MIQGLWYRQDETIIDIKHDDNDADSYKYEPMAALLSRWETIKKEKLCKHCHNQWKHFSPFVLSVEGKLGKEALVLLSQFSLYVAAKKSKPLSHVWQWVNGRIKIAVARSHSQMIHRAWIPGLLWEREPDWDLE